MTFNVNDYLLGHDGVDWPTILVDWSSIVPERFTLWLINRFADLFIVLPSGIVQMLDVGEGMLTTVAESRDDFCNRIDEGNNANNWLMIPLVKKLVAAGVLLQPGQCYGFAIPPVIGGDYTVENCAPISIADYLGAYASIHEQMRDRPDGTKVILTPINVPPK